MSERRGDRGGDGAPPERMGEGLPPRDLYPTSDIRFVLVEIGKFGAQVERSISDVGKQNEKLEQVHHQITFVKGALWVIGSLVVLFGAVGVWYLKDRIAGK